MSYNLGMRVSAEGVETDEQLAFLAEHGCDESQPFLFSPPHCPPLNLRNAYKRDNPIHAKGTVGYIMDCCPWNG